MYLDEVIVFLSRTLFRLIRDHNTRTWPTVEGEIHASGRSSSLYPTAKISYIYSVNGERHFGIHERAYFFRNSLAPPVWATRYRGDVVPD